MDEINRQFDTTQNIAEFTVKSLTERLTNSTNDLHMASKEKYSLKAKLIENASDLSTKEKLFALDQNYDRHCQETWQNIIVFGFISFAIAGAMVGSPTFIKNISRIVA